VTDAPPAAIAHLELPADARYLAVARLALAGVAAELALGEQLLEDLKFALSEAVANAIRHGYPDGAGTVEVRFALRPGQLEICVDDRGAGFDPEQAVSGIGLATMRALVSRLAVESKPGGGTRVTFACPLPAGRGV
jgi:stage II sporulation protein AB (anti-sigma F factor)